MTQLNKRIADVPIPDRLRGLKLSPEGYPVPWFVPYVDGRPEFRGMDSTKFASAIRHKKCWICGGTLGKFLTFPIGPMCAITRTTAEPPSHLTCTQYTAKVCPFLTQPRMRRNEKGMPEEWDGAGIAIMRNPGVTVLWTTLSYKLFTDGANKGYLFTVGDPEHIECYSRGGIAPREELIESISSGYPLLETLAKMEAGGMEALAETYGKGLSVLGIKPEEMYAYENNRSGHGGITSGKNVGEVLANSPGASPSPATQSQRSSEVLYEQGGGRLGHSVQAGPTGQGGDPLAQPSGRRDGLLAKGARRVQVGSKRAVAGAVAVYRKIHRTAGPD
jgi:hypothetical protein